MGNLSGNLLATINSNNAVQYVENTIYATLPVNAGWRSICYGDGKFVAVGGSDLSIAAYSTDGINWTQSTLPASAYWQSVCYGNNKFVAVSNSETGVAYSADGITWTEATMPSQAGWYLVCYGNDKFVAISYYAAYSADGINWTAATIPEDVVASSVCYGNDKFVVVGKSTAAYSADGITWTQVTIPDAYWTSVCCGDSKFVAVSSNSNYAVYSTDGINWTQSTTSIGSNFISVCYGNGKFVAVSNSAVAYSTDGITWTKAAMPTKENYASVCYGNNKFVSVIYNSNAVVYSTDGINWTNKNQTRYVQNSAREDIAEGMNEALGIYDMLEGKADLTELNTLQAGLKGKAAQTALDGVRYQLAAKADQSAVDALRNQVNTKANQSALNTLNKNLNTHTTDTSNPHGVTAAQVGARPDTWMPNLANVAFLGNNPVTSAAADTTANWGALGSGYAWYDTGSQLTDQPSQCGILVNYCYFSDVFQIWNIQNTGGMYIRSGNASGWSGSWKRVALTTDSVSAANRILEDYQTYDLNTLTEGFRAYKCTSSSTNLPAAVYGHLLVMQASSESAYATQLFIAEGNGDGIWKRYQSGGTWTEWVRIIDSNSIGSYVGDNWRLLNSISGTFNASNTTSSPIIPTGININGIKQIKQVTKFSNFYLIGGWKGNGDTHSSTYSFGTIGPSFGIYSGNVTQFTNCTSEQILPVIGKYKPYNSDSYNIAFGTTNVYLTTDLNGNITSPFSSNTISSTENVRDGTSISYTIEIWGCF